MQPAALAGEVLAGRARQPRQRLRAVQQRAARVHARGAAPRVSSSARASPQCTGTADSAACVGVEQDSAATSSISVRSVWWPTEAITGTPSSATVRQSVSSQKQKRSASDPPPRATTITSTSPQAARSCSAIVIRGAAWRSCTGANAHTSRPCQPRRRESGEDVVARLAALAGHDADRARQRRTRQQLLRREQPLGVERLAQLVELREQVALAGDPQRRDRKRERRRRRAAAGVVVKAAGDDDLRPVGERALAERERVEVVAPHRARHGAVGVAQLEVDLRPAEAQVPDLAEELHARALAQELAQLGGVAPTP